MSNDLRSAADAISQHWTAYRDKANRKGDTYVAGYLDGVADAEDIVRRMIEAREQK